MKLFHKVIAMFKPPASPEPVCGLLIDAPISNSEQDILARTSFANELAKVIANQQTTESIVLALRGDWGSGKSSIKNLVVENIREKFENKVHVLEFNPWQWGSDEAISQVFFREIAAALGQESKSIGGMLRAYKFRQYAKLLNSLSGVTKLAGDKTSSAIGWLGSIGLGTAGLGLAFQNLLIKEIVGIILIIGAVSAFTSKVFDFFGLDTDSGKPLELVRAELQNKLKSLPRNLLIVIDDIDRLEPEQIRLVMRLVKSNANLPKITYLLLFQRSIVEKALDSISNNDGGRYLEKIVQVSFDVPVVERARIEIAALKGLEKILKGELTLQNGFDPDRWANIWQGGLRKLFRNLRDVQRFLNVIDTHLNWHRSHQFLEVNLVDFIALEALRVFEPDVFTAIFQAKALLTRGHNRSQSQIDSILAITSSVEGERQSTINIVLDRIFPNFESSRSGHEYDVSRSTEWLQERRACTDRYFDHYFMLRLPDGEISESEFRDFLDLDDKTKIMEAFEAFKTKDHLAVLLMRLNEAKKKLPIKNIAALLPALIDIADALENLTPFVLFTPFDAIWYAANGYLKNIEDINDRGQVLLAAMQNSTGLIIPSVLIDREDERRKEVQQNDLKILTDDDLASVKDLLLSKIKAESAAVERFLANPYFMRIFNKWKILVGEDEPREWVSKIVANDAFFLKLLKVFTIAEHSQALGDYSVQRTKKFRLDWFKDFADLDQVADAVKKIDVSALTDVEREALAAYKAAVSRNTHP